MTDTTTSLRVEAKEHGERMRVLLDMILSDEFMRFVDTERNLIQNQLLNTLYLHSILISRIEREVIKRGDPA